MSWINESKDKEAVQKPLEEQGLTKGEEKCLSSWKGVKPLVVEHCPEFLREEQSRLQRWAPMIKEDGTEDLESISKSEVHRFKCTDQLLDCLMYAHEAVRGITDSKGNAINPPKPILRAQLIPHVVSPTLTKFYRISPHLPQLGAAVSTRLSETQIKNLGKNFNSTAPLFDHGLEGFRRCMDLGNYLHILITTMKRSKILKGSSAAVRSFITSISQCAKDICATATVCSSNFILTKRNEVLSELKGQLTQDAKQKLREAPFTQQALIEDDAFNKAFKAACKIKRADALFLPPRYHATGSRHLRGVYRGSSTRGRGSHSKGTARGRKDHYGTTHRGHGAQHTYSGKGKGRGKKSSRGGRGQSNPDTKPKDN